jgi:zinc transport system substrate-binding protein
MYTLLRKSNIHEIIEAMLKLLLCAFTSILSLPVFSLPLVASKPTVLVSIAPYKYFVDHIGNGLVDTLLFVPPGASPHTFEPTAKKIIDMSKASLWFQMGEPFEAQAIQALKVHNPKLKVYDLRDHVPLICDGPGTCSHNAADPHIWLSPKLAKIQAKTIADALILQIPEKKEAIEKNLAALILELDTLNSKIVDIMKGAKKKSILVSHPAYGYFAKDYGLTQLSIESEGREPSPKKVYEIIKRAKEIGLKTVFAQTQHNMLGAQRIATELGGKVVILDPLSENYTENMTHIAQAFADQP